MSGIRANEFAYRAPFEIASSFLDSAPVDLQGMAKALGASVITENMAPLVSGHIKRSGNGYEIAINAADAQERQRFTLAHEIAHLLLHRDKLDSGLLEDDRMYRSALSTPEERAANVLAARLLMPENLVRLAHKAGADNASKLANLFGVSQQAMEIRLRELRIA